MKERPILFSAPMVRAVLKGSKTQTRRVVKPQPPAGHNWAGWCVCSTYRADEGKATWAAGSMPRLLDAHRVPCPYGMPGDRLWVREAWRALRRFDSMPPLDIEWRSMVAYEADTPTGDYRQAPHGRMGKLRPPIHMPRWASRITLEVTGVRVERLQDISSEDSLAEGIYPTSTGLYPGSPRAAYRNLWEEINGPGSWDTNPWVWVVEFRRLDVARLLDAVSPMSHSLRTAQ